MQISVPDLIERVRNGIDSRDEVIRELYNDSKLNNYIYSFVLKNGGTKDDGHDLLTYSIISFIQQCYSPVFEVRNQLHTYLFSIARYKWINNKKKELKFVEIENREEEFMPSIEDEIIGGERVNLLKNALTQLDEKCKEVMKMWASQMKMREIALRMSYASEQVARKKKHQCLNKLKELLKSI